MSEPHINSYYAATANDRTRFPRLEGSVTADVCVIGGGFSGISMALDLAERGYAVALVEANRIGWGSSGRNGGQMISGYTGEAELKRQMGSAGARMLHDIRYLGHQIIESRISKYGIDCGLKYGWMEAAAKPRHMDGLRAYYADLVKDGDADGFEIVEPKDFRQVLGTDIYFGGLIDQRSGHLHPLNLCMGEARAAASLGVRIFEESRVIDMGGGAKPFVATEHGRIDAKSVVLAGDAHHSFTRGKLNGLMFPTGSYIIASEPLSDSLVRSINPRDLAVCDSNIVLDYFRLSQDKRMLFGGRCNYSNRDPKDLVAALRPRLIEIFPELASTRIDYAWGGRIGIVLNRVPAIGRLEPNLYFMQGYCGHGVNATHAAARIVADAIAGTSERFDLFDKIRHVRLPVGQWAGNQMLALGMLYYRLRDAF